MTKIQKRTVTILDVARYAGVSTSTVSRTLTGNVAVTPEKKEIVMAAIEALGYHPNPSARDLANGTSMLIGVLTQHIASPFYGEILSGIEHGLRNTRYRPMIIPENWRLNTELNALNVFLEHRVDGAIILTGDIFDKHLKQFQQAIPSVILGRRVAGIEDYCIALDNVQAAYEATQHLVQLGHRHIAHVAGPAYHKDSLERQHGYERALQEAGLTINPNLIVQGDFREQSGLMALEMLLTRGVTFSAIFVANDQMAYGVQLALYRRGIRIPDDISLVGFDDIPTSAFCQPPLTTVHQPAFEMGICAAQAVLGILQGEAPNIPPFAAKLMIRESTVRHGSRHSNLATTPVTSDRARVAGQTLSQE